MDDEWRITTAEPGDPVSHVLIFEEVVAAELEDVVAEAVEFLATVPGVTAVEHVEREIVEIDAPGVPAAHLTATLRRWWGAASSSPRPWMSAMEQAVRIVAGLVPGYERDGWDLTRVVDAELTHLLRLDHSFGRGRDEHTVSVSAVVRLKLPGGAGFHLGRRSVDLTDEAALAEAVTGDLLPALDTLPSVDAMLERWRGRRSIATAGYDPYPVHEAELHARVLVARGLLAEAREVYQDAYERTWPRSRAHLLQVVERSGVAPLSTGSNPDLSRAEEATLAAWLEGTAARTGRLQALTGVDLDGSRGSLDEVWGRLSDDMVRWVSDGSCPPQIIRC